MKDQTTVVQFFGYNDRPSWSLFDNYSNWTLALYKPWKYKPEETKGTHSIYDNALENYLLDSN